MSQHTPLIPLSRRRPPSALRATSPVNGGRMTSPKAQPISSSACGGGVREADGGGAGHNHAQTGFRDERWRNVWGVQT